jgi:hypothetical protein
VECPCDGRRHRRHAPHTSSCSGRMLSHSLAQDCFCSGKAQRILFVAHSHLHLLMSLHVFIPSPTHPPSFSLFPLFRTHHNQGATRHCELQGVCACYQRGRRPSVSATSVARSSGLQTPRVERAVRSHQAQRGWHGVLGRVDEQHEHCVFHRLARRRIARGNLIFLHFHSDIHFHLLTHSRGLSDAH